MKKYMNVLLMAAVVLLSGCGEENESNVIKFAISADYPPFEYYKNGKLTGFDVELARLLAEKLGKKAAFQDMQFSVIPPAVQNGSVDAAISCMASTKEREKNFDFSRSYYSESFATVYRKDSPVKDQSQLNKTKIVCQLGSTMEIWLKNHFPQASIIKVDNNNQAIEMLKADHVECVFIDTIQGAAFCKNNADLEYSFIAESENGYAVMVKKGSALKDQINKALDELESQGEIKKLKQKWSLD